MLAETETFPSTEHALALLAASFVIFLAFRAWTHGALKMFWAVVGMSLGAAAGVLCFQHANSLLPGEELSTNLVAMLSVFVALVAYLIFRQLAKSVLQKLFNADGPLSGWAEGFRGALLSLIPSLFTVIVVTTCLRMGGTLLELRSAEKICHPDASWLADTYPGWPMTTEWRDAAESLPYVLPVMDPFDPISRLPERTLVLLLVASKKEELFSSLKSHPSVGPLVNGALFQGLLEDEAIGKMLDERKHVTLLRNQQVVDAASNRVLADFTRELQVRQIIDDFMLSDKRQELLRSYQRKEVPQF